MIIIYSVIDIILSKFTKLLIKLLIVLKYVNFYVIYIHYIYILLQYINNFETYLNFCLKKISYLIDFSKCYGKINKYAGKGQHI